MEIGKKRLLVLIIAITLALMPQVLPIDIPSQAKIVFSVMLFTVTFWFSEVIPLFVTAMFVPFLLVVFAGFTADVVFPPFFDPIIALLFGGLVIALALHKHGLDVEIVDFFLNLFGDTPKMFLLGFMLVTVVTPMLTSSITATAALLIPIGLSALRATKLEPSKSSYAKALVLGIAYAAGIGGIGTLTGTPPNTIAAKFLGSAGIGVGYLEWAFKGLPIAIVMVFVAWFILTRIFKPEIKKIKSPKTEFKPLNRAQWVILITSAVTILLWITSSFHNIHISVISLIPFFSFYLLGVMDETDLQKVGWDALILVGGSLSLGVAIHASGLDAVIASIIGGIVSGQPVFIIFLAMALFSIAFTAFVANTAAASIMVPIAISLAPVLGVGTKALAVLVGMAVSFDFISPFGTPPNALAYSTRYVRVKDMVKAGVFISVAGAVTLSLFALLW